ncbi:hypothetical protein IOP64_003363 [Salmonella enterica]|nr:hypothetical protein [Salmonella enterica subsp. enterica serovar Saintpaul]EGK2137333.1 hypothetical protein [Salmonella enterica]
MIRNVDIRPVFKPHGAFFTRADGSTAFTAVTGGLCGVTRPLLLPSTTATNRIQLRSFPHVIVLAAIREFVPVFPDRQNVFLNNCRVVSASLMVVSLIKGKLAVNDFCLKKVKLVGVRK